MIITKYALRLTVRVERPDGTQYFREVEKTILAPDKTKALEAAQEILRDDDKVIEIVSQRLPGYRDKRKKGYTLTITRTQLVSYDNIARDPIYL